jgi:hypothetical protein
MNILTTKGIQIIDLLDSYNIKPISLMGNKAWFLSPFREESKPSFVVNLKSNRWVDFGDTNHNTRGRNFSNGDTIDLVMILENLSIPEALNFLERKKIPSFLFREHKKINTEPGKIEIYHLHELRGMILINYLKNRGIDVAIAKMYVQEAYYLIDSRQYFALAFKNDLGGYELRNKHFKGGSSPKYFTTIPGKDPAGLNIFEGFFDFLSFATYFTHSYRENTSVILNSLVYLKNFLPQLGKYERVNIFLDNDEPGRNSTRRIQEIKPCSIDHMPLIYPAYKDFNVFLMMRKSLSF